MAGSEGGSPVAEQRDQLEDQNDDQQGGSGQLPAQQLDDGSPEAAADDAADGDEGLQTRRSGGGRGAGGKPGRGRGSTGRGKGGRGPHKRVPATRQRRVPAVKADELECLAADHVHLDGRLLSLVRQLHGRSSIALVKPCTPVHGAVV